MDPASFNFLSSDFKMVFWIHFGIIHPQSCLGRNGFGSRVVSLKVRSIIVLPNYLEPIIVFMGPAHLSRLNVFSYTSCVWPLVRHATVVTIVTTDKMAHVR